MNIMKTNDQVMKLFSERPITQKSKSADTANRPDYRRKLAWKYSFSSNFHPTFLRQSSLGIVVSF